jgi:hypothetical protein
LCFSQPEKLFTAEGAEESRKDRGELLTFLSLVVPRAARNPRNPARNQHQRDARREAMLRRGEVLSDILESLWF